MLMLDFHHVCEEDGGGGLINQFVTPTFYLYFAFSGINFRDMLHHVCDMTYDENMSRPIRTVNVGAQID